MGWFTPKPPLISLEKARTEWCMCRLADRFTLKPLLEAEVIPPEPEYFPEHYAGNEEDVRPMLERVCEHMGIRADRIEVVLDYPNVPPKEVDSEYTLIRVPAGFLHDPERLIASLVHGVSREILVGAELLGEDEPDHEGLVDLLPVYLGIGIFEANAVIRESFVSFGKTFGWRHERHGALPARILGYAHALFAYMREEASPSWGRSLRLDAEATLKDGLRYLHKTGDTIFHLDLKHGRDADAPLSDLILRMRSGTTSAKLTALWDIDRRKLYRSEIVDALAICLGDKDPYVAAEAGRVAGRMGEVAGSLVPALVRNLSHKSLEARGGAIRGLGMLRAEPELVRREVTEMLAETSNRTLVAETCVGLRLYGPEMDAIVPALTPHLKRGLVDCDYPLIEQVAATIHAVSENPEEDIAALFPEHDPELRDMALRALEEHPTAPDILAKPPMRENHTPI